MANKIFADLHNHTTASDGDFNSARLLEKATSLGIKAVGITDHDTLAGLKTAIEIGKKMNADVISGVEVSVRFKRSYFTGTLHLLCYFSPQRLADIAFVRAFNDVLKEGRGKKLVKSRIHKINAVFGPGGKTPLLHRDMKYPDIERLSSNASRRHFTICLKNSFDIRDKKTINRMIGNTSPSYLPSGVALEKIKSFIQSYPVLAVLAHPAAGSFEGQEHYKEVLPPLEIVEKILPEFMDAGLKGIEVYYPGHMERHIKILKGWAQEFNLIVTGGSDCHDDRDRPFGVQGISRLEYDIFKQALI